jgi:spore coat polysaccharide biosynthesis protein SpsF (cytidylyltransferase family)
MDLRFTIDDVDDFQILSKIYDKINYDDNIDLLFKNVDDSLTNKNHMISNIKKYTK